MNLRKKVLLVAGSMMLLPMLLIGCSKRVITSNGKVLVEEGKGTVKEISMYYDRDKAKNNVLQSELEKIVKDKKLMDDKKAVIVKFYEYEGEAYFNDTVPYAVGYWGPKDGSKNAYDLVSSKNNDYFVLKNVEKEMEISEEDTVAYEKILKTLKSLKSESNDKLSLRQELLFNAADIEKLDIDLDLAQEVIDKYLGRFDDYATQNVIYGNFEE